MVSRFTRALSPVWNGISTTFNSVDDYFIGLQNLIPMVVGNGA